MATDVFDTYATLSLDSKKYDEGLKDAGDKANVFADVLKANLVGKGIDLAISGFVKLGEIAVGTIKSAVDSYGSYEQLIGGVETLFQSSADKVKDYAMESYKTAGISANKYMETVTSFSASLIQSTGRGTQQNIEELEKQLEEQYKKTKRSLEDQYEAAKKTMNSDQLRQLKREQEDQLEALKETNKELIAQAETMNNQSVSTAESLDLAAELANQAVIDMSDNANKMGTDMSSIQAAYQGFAKQNFTMLDNLKLGFGGTKSEMERLLEHAEQVKQANGEMVEYSIDSFADIVEAIHVVQEEMGISGTTAKEAEGTITGSLSTVKAAWENLLTAMAGGGKTLDEALSDMVESLKGFIGNIIPIIQQAIMGFADLVRGIAPIISETLPELVDTILPKIMDALMALTNSLIDAFPTILQAISAQLPNIVSQLVDVVSDLLEMLMRSGIPLILEMAAKVLIALAEGIANNLPKLVPALIDMVEYILAVIVQNLPTIIKAGLQIILALVTAIVDNQDKLLKLFLELILSVAGIVILHLPDFIQLGMKIILKLAEGVLLAIPRLLMTIAEGLGLVKKKVNAETDSMDRTVKTTRSNINNNLTSLERELGVSSRSIKEQTGQIATYTNSSLTQAEYYSEKIERVASLSKQRIETVVNGLGPMYDYALQRVNAFAEQYLTVMDKVINEIELLNLQKAEPEVDPSGVEAGCGAIVSAVANAKSALLSLSNTSVGGGGFGGGRASGGWVTPGSTYLVGEHGPELITPTRTEYVHNSPETARMLGNGGIVINIQGDIYDDERSMKRKLKNAILGVMEEQVAYG